MVPGLLEHVPHEPRASHLSGGPTSGQFSRDNRRLQAAVHPDPRRCESMPRAPVVRPGCHVACPRANFRERIKRTPSAGARAERTRTRAARAAKAREHPRLDSGPCRCGARSERRSQRAPWYLPPAPSSPRILGSGSGRTGRRHRHHTPSNGRSRRHSHGIVAARSRTRFPRIRGSDACHACGARRR